ncbi:hypothetical protein [Caballeronia sp. LZ043]|uniref:hypothetical protein n=1 Tax=Caballeronia sp. LZ043 TaxID=3038569 RepID=UPI0028665A1B|nr:hypothetical protein [Caballeronia sp. LZ043]MDR5823906.1 hypothetical protein [Caballeronia sp. LZ043]
MRIPLAGAFTTVHGRTGNRLNPWGTYDLSVERLAAVKLIERQSKATATIEWHDVTRGSYGDPVYAPNSRPVPSNAGAMILASVLDQAMPR